MSQKGFLIRPELAAGIKRVKSAVYAETGFKVSTGIVLQLACTEEALAAATAKLIRRANQLEQSDPPAPVDPS